MVTGAIFVDLTAAYDTVSPFGQAMRPISGPKAN
jgi:hypothetical protein